MNFWSRLRSWFSATLWRSRMESEMDAELRFHIEAFAEDLMRGGVSRAEAMRRARIEFGGIEPIKEEGREARGLTLFDSLHQDMRFGLRMLRKNPVFSMTTITSLALGIASVVSIFTAADALLFRPLPYRDASKLVMLWESNRVRPDASHSVVSPDNFLDWKDRNSVFEDMAVVDEGRSVFNYGERSEELRTQGVSANFFTMLGVQAIKGRIFADESLVDSQGSTLLISYRLWQDWFGGDPGVIGRRVLLDSFPRTILGVMPEGFSFGNQEVDLWPSMQLRPSTPHDRGPRNMIVVARLKEGITAGQAQSQMQGIASQLEQEDPQFNKNWTVVVEQIRDSFARGVKISLLLLLGAVSLLLVVTCANVANLLLARYTSRRSEMAVRITLGAGRVRLLRQLLTESMLLALLSGAAGLALGRWALAAILAFAPQSLTRTAGIAIDWRIVLFTIGLSSLVGILFGLAPSLLATGPDVVSGLKRKSPRRLAGRGNARAWLIASEIALSVGLLVGASLLFRSFVKLQSVDSGLHPRNVLTFHFRVMSPHDTNRFHEAVSGIEHLPGVSSVSAISFLPFDEVAAVTPVNISGKPLAKPGEEIAATVRTVMPRYFETIGIPIQQGRDFTELDNTPQSPMHFLVNEAFARKYLDGEDPLGKTISVKMARSNPFADIVGVVGNVREGSLTGEAVPTVYYVHAHMPYGQMTLVVRSERDPEALVGSVRSTMHDLDPTLAVAGVKTMQSILEETYARERFTTQLMGAFSAAALLLAAVGIYGVMAYSVSERTNEIGVRLAVGASPRQIVAMVLSDGAWVVAGGLAAGTLGAFILSRLLSSFLFETSATDPFAFAFALTILLLVALASAYLPARRAMDVEPIAALKYE
jgi:putative ABC transport system permease protein